MEQMVQTEQQDLRDHKVMLDRKGQQVQMVMTELMVQMEQQGLKDQQVMSDHRGQQVLME